MFYMLSYTYVHVSHLCVSIDKIIKIFTGRCIPGKYIQSILKLRSKYVSNKMNGIEHESC